MVHWATLTVAFLLELCALAALGSWGVHVGGGPAAKALLWGRFAAPRAPVSRPAVKVGVQLLVFGSAALALFATGHRALAAAFAILVVANTVLVRL